MAKRLLVCRSIQSERLNAEGDSEEVVLTQIPSELGTDYLKIVLIRAAFAIICVFMRSGGGVSNLKG